MTLILRGFVGNTIAAYTLICMAMSFSHVSHQSFDETFRDGNFL